MLPVDARSSREWQGARTCPRDLQEKADDTEEPALKQRHSTWSIEIGIREGN